MSAAAPRWPMRGRSPRPNAPSLVVERLTTSIRIDRQWFDAVRDVSFEVHPRETLALVGESGCGKSLTALSVMGLLPEGVGRISSGAITGRRHRHDGGERGRGAGDARRPHRHDLPGADDLAQPGPAVGFQIAESLVEHRGMSRARGTPSARSR